MSPATINELGLVKPDASLYKMKSAEKKYKDSLTAVIGARKTAVEKKGDFDTAIQDYKDALVSYERSSKFGKASRSSAFEAVDDYEMANCLWIVAKSKDLDA